MQKTSYEHGVPSWIDMGVEDMDKAVAFYGGLFGWEVMPAADDAGGYRIALLDGQPVAGLGPKMNPGPPTWTTAINVDQLEAVLAKADAAGGATLMPAMDVLTAGRLAMITDTNGAVLSLWQPGDHKGAGRVNEPGALCWNELSTRDVDGALAFYPAVFGWDHSSSTEGPMPYTEWKVGGASIAGMMPMPDMVPAEVPDFWMVYFAVEDCDAAMAKVTELGGTVVNGPMEVPVGRFAVVTDDQGALFSVIALSDTSA